MIVGPGLSQSSSGLNSVIKMGGTTSKYPSFGICQKSPHPTLVCCMVSKSKSKRLRWMTRWFGRDLMEHLLWVLSVTARRSPVFFHRRRFVVFVVPIHHRRCSDQGKHQRTIDKQLTNNQEQSMTNQAHNQRTIDVQSRSNQGIINERSGRNINEQSMNRQGAIKEQPITDQRTTKELIRFLSNEATININEQATSNRRTARNSQRTITNRSTNDQGTEKPLWAMKKQPITDQRTIKEQNKLF